MNGARERFEHARVARLATVAPDGAPHVVPVCFALHGDIAYFAVDHKPKRSARLQRLVNIAAEPRVALLVDRYDDDWSRLWWARADGRAREVQESREYDRAIVLLVERYPQYRERPPQGPAVAIDVERWSDWCP